MKLVVKEIRAELVGVKTRVKVFVSAKHVRRYGLPDISDTESSEEDEDQPEGDDSDDEDNVSNTGSTSRSWCAIS